MSDKFAAIKRYYEDELKFLDDKSKSQRDRSYGGMIRSNKGNLTEEIARMLNQVILVRPA